MVEKKTNYSWSEMDMKLVKKLHEEDNLTLTKIAERFNTTKNSLLGAYWRYRKKKGENTSLLSSKYTPPRGFITKSQLQKILGISMGSINNMLKELPHIKLGNSRNCRVLFNENIIFSYIEQKYGNEVLKQMNKVGERNDSTKKRL